MNECKGDAEKKQRNRRAPRETSGEPALRQACRSDVSAVAVEAFVNYAGLGGQLPVAGLSVEGVACR
jgi:hypothetical protein